MMKPEILFEEPCRFLCRISCKTSLRTVDRNDCSAKKCREPAQLLFVYFFIFLFLFNGGVRQNVFT